MRQWDTPCVKKAFQREKNMVALNEAMKEYMTKLGMKNIVISMEEVTS